MKEKKYVVGIDLGTTSARTIIFDFEGNQIGKGQLLNPLTYPSAGRQECDGEELINTLYNTTRMAIDDAKIDPEQIASVSADCFRCTVALRDKDGGFTMPIIIWQDMRSAEMIPEIEKKLNERGMTKEEFYDRCGMPLGGVNPQSNLQWIKKYMPEAYENATTIHTMMGLIMKAYGADDYYDDYTDTPWTQLNGRDFQYDPELCDILGIDINKMAPLKKPGEVIGYITDEVAERTGLAKGTPLIMGTGDQQSGCLGCGCIDDTIGYAAGGTAGIVAGKSFKMMRDPSRRCYVLGTPDGAYVMEGVANACGSAFKWFKEEFCTIEQQAADMLDLSVYQFLTSMATKSNEGANGLFFLPYFAGAVVPNLNPNARGSYVGIAVGHTKADFIRATMEGVCFDLRDMLDAMVAGGAPPFEKVRLTGGIFRSELWCQIMCDILNRDCEVVAEEEATALGCAMNAAVGAGIYKDYKDAEKTMVKLRKVYHPRADKVERYEEAFKTWQQNYKSLATGAYDAIVAFQDKYRGVGGINAD
jgi:xylulokinase